MANVPLVPGTRSIGRVAVTHFSPVVTHRSCLSHTHARARARTSRTLARHSAIIFHPVSVQFLNRLMLSNATDRASFAGIEVGEISFEPFFFFIINEDTIEEQVVSE